MNGHPIVFSQGTFTAACIATAVNKVVTSLWIIALTQLKVHIAIKKNRTETETEKTSIKSSITSVITVMQKLPVKFKVADKTSVLANKKTKPAAG